MYLEIDEGFPGHRKTLRLCAALKNPEAAWYVIRLWTWACRSCPTGDLHGMDPYDIEIAVQYRPLDGACYAAMVAAGFIDEKDGRPYEIHDWMERTGGAIARMAEAAARKKDYRAHRDGKCDPEWCRFCADAGMSADSPQDKPPTGTGTSVGQTDQDKTSPAQSSPDRTAAARDPWHAHRWLQKFGQAWCEKYGRPSYGHGQPDAIATAGLGDVLATLTPEERRAAEERAPQMFAEYLGSTAPGRVSARHPFKWFVEDFNGLRVPTVPLPPASARGSPGRGQPSTATRDAAARYLAKHGELP